MRTELKTKSFQIEYTEKEINSLVLWDNHCHSQFEMIGILEGDITILLEGTPYRVSQSQAVIIPPLAYHTITANKGGSYRRLTALFEDEALPHALRPYFIRKDTNIFIVQSAQLESLKRVCQEENPIFYESLAEALMTQVFYEALQSSPKSLAAEADEFLQKAIGYIENHMGEKISLKELATHTSRSMSSLCHLFEEKMRVSPKQYILHKKLALANKLIEEGVPPTLAAARIGYDNYSNFYRMYRKRYGICPKSKK